MKSRTIITIYNKAVKYFILTFPAICLFIVKTGLLQLLYIYEGVCLYFDTLSVLSN